MTATIRQAERAFHASLSTIAVFYLAANLLLLVIPLYMLQIYDRVLPAHSGETLLFLSLIAGAALVLIGLVEVARAMIATRAAARFDAGLSDAAMRALVRNGGGAASLQPVRDIATLRGLIASRAVFNLLDVPFATIFIAILWFIHPDLFWLTLAGALVLCLLTAANEWATRQAGRRQGDAALAASRQAEAIAREAEALAAMGMVGDAVEQWGSEHAASLVAADRASRINAWFAGVSRVLRFALQMAVLGYGALLVLAGEMTAGMIFAASLISGRALQPIDQTIGSWRQLSGGWQTWARLRKFMGAAPEDAARTALEPPKGRLEVSDIHQPASGDATRPPILQRVTFRLEAGQSLAVIGPSGSGKSTLARILVGVLRPRVGTVRIDDHDIANWEPERLGRFIGYVPQRVDLLPGTIAANIARFRPEASPDEIRAAAAMAHVEELVARLPKGYDTVIGSGGVQLSGGELQRIALARAFFGGPKLLVLDEPNSNLDAAGDRALAEALQSARQAGVTVVIVTQRQTVLGAVDKVLVLEAGVMREFVDAREFLDRLRPKPVDPAPALAAVPIIAGEAQPRARRGGRP